MKQSLDKLYSGAQGNANYFARPYVVFIDASGNARCERYDAGMTCHNDVNAEVFYPQQAAHAIG